MRKICQVLLFAVTASWIQAQQVDLLIKGGHVIDPKNNIDAIMDVTIDDGKVLQVAESISADGVFQVIDATGMYVVPGLIDLHGHHFFGTKEDAYLSDSYASLPPDGFVLRAGVTTVVDVGGAGWRNFRTFKNQAIDHSKTRVLSFLNIVGSGMGGGAVEQNLADMDAKLTAQVAKKYPEYVVGVKVAHYYGPEWQPVERAVEAGRQAGIPVMVDFGAHDPPLSLETLFMEKLRPGDIFTHCYGQTKNRMHVVDQNTGKLQPYSIPAQERGIIMDVGHGGGSFTWDQAVPAIAQGLKPNTISTDLHTGSMNGGMKNMNNVMSKFLNLGLTMPEVIRASTWKPAQVISREELGHLSSGAGADVALLRVVEGDFGFVDTNRWTRKGTKKIVCELTLRDGTVVWDLNGISRPEWESRH